MVLDAQPDSQRPKDPRLSVQITQIDHILSKPGPLDASELSYAPVIRIFGASSIGKKACLYVHQVYPYFFVEYTGDLDPESVRTYTRRLTRSLNHAIAISLKRKPGSSNAVYVRAIVLVKGIHFYGFHTTYSPFLKVYIIDPGHVHRAVTILQSGTVMGTRFRTFENHLSYILQFLCDFGLYGCGWIDLEDVLQRDPLRDEETQPSDMVFAASPHSRQSRMALEVDAIAPHILNRHKVPERKLHHQLQIPAPPLPQEPVVLGVRELWEDERRRRAARGLDPSPQMPLDPSEASRGKGGDWVAEARWWNQLRKKIESDMQPIQASASGWENYVVTAFESVEVLWEERWRSRKPTSQTTPERDAQLQETAGVSSEKDIDPSDIDLKLLSAQDMSEAAEIDEQRAIYDEDDESDEESEYPEDVQPEDEALSEVGEDDDQENPFENSSTPPIDPEYTLNSPRNVSYSQGRQQTPFTPTKMQDTDKTMGETSSDDDATPRPQKRLQSQGEASRGHLTESDTPDVRRRLFKTNGESSRLVNVQIATEEGPTERVTKGDHNHIHIPGPLFTLTNVRRRISTFDPKQPLTAFETAKSLNSNRYEYTLAPPSKGSLISSLDSFGIPRKIYQAPFYSDGQDAPDKPREYAGLVYRLKSGGLGDLDDWMGSEGMDTSLGFPGEVQGWEYANSPPTRKRVKQWLSEHPRPSQLKGKGRSRSQVQGPTPVNIYGLSTLSIFKKSGTSGQNNITVLSLELFVPTQGEKVPNAQEDEIAALSFAFHANDTLIENGTVIVQRQAEERYRYALNEPMELVDNELDLLNRAIDLVNDLEPDILTGWDVQRASWGYLDARGKSYGNAGLEIPELISRGPLSNVRTSLQWETRKTSTFKVAGRHVFNLWRLMRSEKALTSYTLENVVFQVLKKRIPFYSSATLTEWYMSGVPSYANRVLEYCSRRAALVIELIDQSELVTKTAEFARVFGIDFFSVISRGSQFKVESFMFRLAKPENFVLISPSKRDVGRQNAAECMPLIMEPQSALYTSPLLVLDFQSLYPSVMIAYNYCYSTCLGRVRPFQGKNKFGVVSDLEVPPGLLATLGDHVHIAPNGMIYVNSDVRKGLLGRMLIELLETRVMVKQAQKSAGSDKSLYRILEARQLGLKYIANVTYGYTSATYSGRMPAVEIADSIVQSGRETLEKAIAVINNSKKWNAEVVYGDTDSLFVYLPGRTKDQAFQIGNDIAATITSHNPKPIKLKFEKVYFPCVLMAKKRYVGFKFENPDDTEPVFDAKGIETVRRDGIPAQRKMTENVLRMLFHTKDLSLIKDYCCRTWANMLENRTSIQEFIFAKEVRMGTYSENVPPPPGVAVAARKMLHDPINEPHYGERIPYVIIRGAPGSRLTERAMDPLELLNDSELQIDVKYYISRVLIPPLERILNLVGADVRHWFDEMAKPRVAEPSSPSKAMAEALLTPGRAKLGEHFSSMQCVICGGFAPEGLCYPCYKQPQETWARALGRLQANDRNILETQLTCMTCTSSQGGSPIECESIDCPWLYSRKRAENNTAYLEEIQDLLWDLDHDPDDSSSEEEEEEYDEEGELTEIASEDEDEEMPLSLSDDMYQTP